MAKKPTSGSPPSPPSPPADGAPARLPRIGPGHKVIAEKIDISNDILTSISNTITDMSTRLNIKLGSMASMMSDFFSIQQKSDLATESLQGAQLYGINVKLGSIAMMLSEFFEDQARRRTRDDLLDDDKDRTKPPGSGGDKDKSKLNFRDMREEAGGWISSILTGLGAAFLAGSYFDDAILDSGIVAYISKALSGLFLRVSGIGKMLMSVAESPIFVKLAEVGGKIMGAANWVFSKIIPLYSTFMHLGKGIGRFFPLFAAVTTVLDFLKGFNSQDSVIDGIKEGIAEVAAGWIGWPLNILKDIVSWALGKLGFENAAEWVGELDFVEPVKTLVRSMFDTVKGIFSSFDSSKLGDWEMWHNMILDIVHLPINLTVNAIKRLFNVGDPDVDFNFREWLSGLMQTTIDWLKSFFTVENFKSMGDSVWQMVKDTFTFIVDENLNAIKKLLTQISSFLPSLEDIKKKLTGVLPTWLGGEEESASSKLVEIEKNIAEQTDALARSRAGENVYWGDEEAGQKKAVIQLEETKRLRDEIRREMEKKNQPRGGDMNINVVNGGNNYSATSHNTTFFSGSPSNGRADH